MTETLRRIREWLLCALYCDGHDYGYCLRRK